MDGTTYNFLGTPGVPNVNPLKAVQKSMTVSVLCVPTDNFTQEARSSLLRKAHL